MNALSISGALLLALALSGGPPSQQGSLAEEVSLQVPVGWSIENALSRDVNGDGELDLVLGVNRRGQDFERALMAYTATRLNGRAAFESGPRLDLTPDVVSWALADVHPDPGVEIVLFTARAVFSWRSRAPEEQRFAKLFETDFLWQLPDEDEAFPWAEGVRDLDGDGLDDLWCPEPDGVRIWLQRRSGAGGGTVSGLESRLAVPRDRDDEGMWISSDKGQPSFRGNVSNRGLAVTFQSEGEEGEFFGPSALLEVHESVPAVQLADWDADGDLDVIAQSSRQLYVWLLGADGHLPRDPSLALLLPVEADRSRRLDASYSSHLVDLDLDRRSDCVIFAGDRRSKDIRTQALVFTQNTGGREARPAPLFDAEGRPRDLLVLGGFVSSVELADFDGDGRPDLVVRTIRPDLLDQLRSISSESIEVELFVYVNTGGRFDRKPRLAWSYDVKIEEHDPLVIALGDVSGDRIAEFLVRSEPGKLRMLMARQRGDTLKMIDQPIWERALDRRAAVELIDNPGRALPDVLVVERYQVTRVRFGR